MSDFDIDTGGDTMGASAAIAAMREQYRNADEGQVFGRKRENVGDGKPAPLAHNPDDEPPALEPLPEPVVLRNARRAAAEQLDDRTALPPPADDGKASMVLPLAAWAELFGQPEALIRRAFKVPADSPSFTYRYKPEPDFPVIKHLRSTLGTLAQLPSTVRLNGDEWVVDELLVDSETGKLRLALSLAMGST